MAYTLGQSDRSELHSIIARNGLDTVLQELSWMLQDSIAFADNEELRTAILKNAFAVMKASDEIVYRAHTGKDLYDCQRIY